MADENKPMIIKDGWFCYGADFDCKEPHFIIANKNVMADEVKVPVPESVAYYLKTHWCGSQQMHDTIEEGAIRGMRHKLKEILGI